jgi:hypothetical protein
MARAVSLWVACRGSDKWIPMGRTRSLIKVEVVMQEKEQFCTSIMVGVEKQSKAG